MLCRRESSRTRGRVERAANQLDNTSMKKKEVVAKIELRCDENMKQTGGRRKLRLERASPDERPVRNPDIQQ
jgi:hypothetical protein